MASVEIIETVEVIENKQLPYKESKADVAMATGIGAFLGGFGGAVTELLIPGVSGAVLHLSNIYGIQEPSAWLVLPAGLAIIGAAYFFDKEFDYITLQTEQGS